MAISQTHTRSISLPSRLHPINPTNFETELEKLKSLQINSAKSEGIQSGLLSIAELYTSVKKITQSQQKSVEEALSSSVELLDSCNAIREMVQMMRENVQALQSALRRKGSDSSGLQNDIAAYLCCRKRVTKSIAKTLKKSEQMVRNNASNSNFASDFRELAGITVAIFRSILLFFLQPATRAAGWSLVSKLTIGNYRRENDVVNEVGIVDFALSNLQGKTRSNGVTVLDVQKRLRNLEAVIEGFEGGLERLFRQLVQTRVTLLNILTDH